MPQLHLYVSDDVAAAIRARAQRSGSSVSRYLTSLVTKDIAGEWPPGFFEDVVGAWEGEPLTRPPQSAFEEREPL